MWLCVYTVVFTDKIWQPKRHKNCLLFSTIIRHSMNRNKSGVTILSMGLYELDDFRSSGFMIGSELASERVRTTLNCIDHLPLWVVKGTKIIQKASCPLLVH